MRESLSLHGTFMEPARNQATRQLLMSATVLLMSAVVVLLGTLSFSRADTGRDGAVRIPEVYLDPRFNDYCVMRTDLDGGDQISRRDRLISFIRRSYVVTEKWHHKYIVSAVDYVEFRYFYMVLYSKCEAARGELDEGRRLLLNCGDNNSDRCDLSATFAIESNSPLVAKSDHMEVPISLFDRLRGRAELRDCTIEIPTRVPTQVEELQSLINHLNLIRTEYRMSIIDIYLANNRFYILFSRQCDRKSDIFAEAQKLIDSEDFHPGNYLAGC